MKFWLIISCILFSISINAQNFHVMNAGHVQANGTYVYSGEINGYPNWTNGIYSLHFTNDIGCTPKWVIMHADTMIYKNYDWTSDPPTYNWQTTCYSGSIYPPPIVLSEQPTVFWSYCDYIEQNDNSGQIIAQPPLTASLYSYLNVTFTGNTGEDFVAAGKVSVTNVPAGLSIHVFKTCDTSLQVLFTGAAIQHRAINTVYNCSIVLNSNATSANDSLQVVNNNSPNITIRFLQPQMYSNAMYFNELSADIGTVENSPNRKIYINRFGGESFAGSIGEDFFQTGKVLFNNLPLGLQPEIILMTDTLLSVAMQGAAIHHDNNDDVYPVHMFFRSIAFTGNDSSEVLGSPVSLGFNFFGTIGAEFIDNEGSPVFYPNPAGDFILVESLPEDQDVVISDITGKKIMITGPGYCDISRLPPGIYILTFEWEGNVRNTKLIKN